MFLLDTDTCIEVLRGNSVAALERMEATPPGSLGASSITAAELMYGALHSERPREQAAHVAAFLEALEPIHFDEAAAVQFARIKQDLVSSGQMIGVMDLLIAATACSVGATLITGNTREFSRVPGLNVESWIR